MRTEFLHRDYWARWLKNPFSYRWRGARSLTQRVLMLYFLSTAVIFVIAVSVLWWTSNQLIEDNLNDQASRWITELDQASTPLYVSRDKKYFAQIEKRVRHFPEIALVRYYDVSGTRVMGEYQNLGGAEAPPLPRATIEQLAARAHEERPYVVIPDDTSSQFVRFVAPVRVRSIRADGMYTFTLQAASLETVKVIGYIDLIMNPGPYRAQLSHRMLLGSLVIAFLVALSLVVWRKLIQRALAPLTRLQQPLAQLAAGNIDIQVETTGDVEIAAVGHALNATISALKERDRKLRQLADSDAMTGLLNRASFSRRLDQEIGRVALEGGSSALFFIDLDQFKYINDTLGHAVGDRLLIQIAEQLRTRMRARDAICRFGGDEFTVLAIDVGCEEAKDIARSLVVLMQQFLFQENGQFFNVNCSIGVTMIDSDRYGGEEIIGQADMACHVVKARGRNSFHVHDAEDRDKNRMVAEVSWSRLIKQMIEEDRFVLVYQRIHAIKDTKGPGHEFFEVLLRMPGTHGELLTPAAFLPAAERFGLINAIDRWVIARALRKLAEYRRDGRDIVFSINLSGASFNDPELLAMIQGELKRHELPPQCLVFEITEQIAVRHLDQASTLMKILEKQGCQFALDDFGTGFSAFGYLKHLPIAYIKIGLPFIADLACDPINQAMMRSIIQMAKALGKQTIAENVEDEAAFTLLREYGVNYVQGYLLGAPSIELPRPPAEVIPFAGVRRG